jgi:hypothetical protein
MSKVVGSYASVTRGVSEQVPQDRHPGQMWEQVNMISDPVVGLARRPGSSLKAMVTAAAGAALTANMQNDIRLYREYTFFNRGKEYSLLYRTAAAAGPYELPPFLCYCKTDARFLGVWYMDGGTANPAAATGLAPWITGGVSALATVGDYLAIAANTLGPGYSINDRYAQTATQGVAWCRGGAYSRTYTIKITRSDDGHVFSASYTTMASSYPNLLSTADIVSGASDYQKQVNDRVNAYNSAVNKWIGDAAASITPQNIASQLASQLNAAGYTNLGTMGGTIFMDHITSLSVDDGGDGTLFRGIHNTLDDVAKLSPIHGNGKVVQVKANNQVDPYYMVFKTDDGSYWSTGKWVEGPAQVITPGQVFAVAGITPDGNSFCIGSTPSVLNNGGTFTCPQFTPSVCGDKDQTAAIPYFFGKKISLMTMFQDRLVIVADGTIFMSRSGDYFNWFRQTMFSVQDDDPIQVYALGAQDDTISKCVTYNKNLFMFGLRNQYVIPGNSLATPKDVSVGAVAHERDASTAQPVTSGNFVFYGTAAVAGGTQSYSGIISQFQLGLFQDVPETYQISKQLARYIKGRPIELEALNTPSTLFVRTDGVDNGFYVYSYLDAAGTQSREFDSWSRWECSASCGHIAAMSQYRQRPLTFWFMPDAAAGGSNILAVVAEFNMDTTDRSRPFIDLQTPITSTGPINGQWGNWQTTKMWADARVTPDSTKAEFLINAKMTGWGTFVAQYPAIAGANMVVGFDYPSYVTLTAPYFRDDHDKAIVNGRLVVNKYTVSFTDTSGCDVLLTDYNGTNVKTAAYNARLVGHSNNLVGRIPITTSVFPVPVGRANTEHKVTFQSKPVLPMTISAVEWVGQFFTSGRRV